MKIHLLSDLHLEFGGFNPPPTDADVVVLAGDIDSKGHGIEWALDTFKCPTVYVAGNHEYYDGHLSKTLTKMRKLAEGTHVRFLSDDVAVIDGVRFIGTTLWTDYKLTGNYVLAQLDAKAHLKDFKYIREKSYSKILPSSLQTLNAHARRFLYETLSTPFEGKTVVVSHHAPSELSIHPRFRTRTDHVNASYASRLDDLMGADIELWVHGHTHDSFDYELYGTRVVCNPRGYLKKETTKDLNPSFDPSLVLTI